MPAIDISGCCIPAECDNIKLPYNSEIASLWDAYLLCDICRHFASAMLHFASLISHNLRCIPAYAHQIPKGFFQSLLNYHRDNLYIIPKKIPRKAGWGEMPCEEENLGINPNRHEFRVREMLVETRINVCYDKRFLK